MTRQWVVVADAGLARFFSFNGRPDHASEVESLNNEDAHKTESELVTDRPGRMYNGFGNARSVLGTANTHKDKVAVDFARKVSRKLEAAHKDHRFDRLTLVAPPGFLGLLRQEMGHETSKAVTHEFHKDLVHQEPEQIRQHLSRLMP